MEAYEHQEMGDPPGGRPAAVTAPVVLGGSVGRNGKNLPADVAKIGAALVAIGPNRGGIYGVPLSVEGLAEAIKLFQDFHHLPSRDGRVDPGGGTLKKINSVLFPHLYPPTPKPTGTGHIKKIDPVKYSLVTACRRAPITPTDVSLSKDMLFHWTAVAGGGAISYFELDENVVPKWFGVLVPTGTTSFDKVHIFFHPTPGQADYDDSNYSNLSEWKGIFHYLTDHMGAQFCAAGTGRVMVMPLLTSGASGTCGIFPQRWESIVGKILGMVRTSDATDTAPAQAISNVVVSSFSAGVAYSHAFLTRAKLGSKLKGVIDFDGSFSTERSHSASIAAGFNPVIRMQQMAGVREADLPSLAARNLFPLKPSRFNEKYPDLKDDNKTDHSKLHGLIPQTTMFIAAQRAG